MGVTIQLEVLYIGTGTAKYAVSIERHIAKATYRATKQLPCIQRWSYNTYYSLLNYSIEVQFELQKGHLFIDHVQTAQRARTVGK